MSVTNRAGRMARTDRDDSHAQNSSATRCAICGHRDADGINADGRPLCRLCARTAGRLTTDGGHTRAELDDAKARTQTLVTEFSGVNEANVTVRHNRHYVIVDTEQRTKLPAALVERIEHEVGLRLRGVEPFVTVKNGVRARFRFDDSQNLLDRLASEFQNRREQSKIARDEHAERTDKEAADFEQGRILAFQEARSAVLAVQRGENDD